MFRGFNVELNLEEDLLFGRLYNVGLTQWNNHREFVEFNVDEFLMRNQALDGTQIQNFWFSQIEADVFISHSHKDQKQAIAFSGWLHSTFGIKSFIDSCLWGYSGTLLRQLDNEYCFNRTRNVYDYQRRNRSTSHVHMMLSSALTMMMDKTECLFFINTPNSILTFDGNERTESPWLYSEIIQFNVIRKRIPNRTQSIDESFSNFSGDAMEKALNISYELDLSHLIDINSNDLNHWSRITLDSEHPLDTLYRYKPLTKSKNTE